LQRSKGENNIYIERGNKKEANRKEKCKRKRTKREEYLWTFYYPFDLPAELFFFTEGSVSTPPVT